MDKGVNGFKWFVTFNDLIQLAFLSISFKLSPTQYGLDWVTSLWLRTCESTSSKILLNFYNVV